MTRINMSIKGLLVLMIACLAITACSSGSGNGEVDGEGNKLDEISIVFIGADQKEMKEVEEAISKITAEKIGAKVKMTAINWGAWSQQTTLMLAGNEKVDLMVTSNTLYNYASQVAKGQLQPLDELLEKHGQGIMKTMEPEFLYAAQVDGKTYGIPSYRDMAVNYGAMMRTDLLDKYKIDKNGIKTLDDVEKVFEIIKKNEPSVTPLVAGLGGTTPFELLLPAYFDVLGDSLGVLPWSSDELKVVNMFETEEYANLVKRARSWYNAGYIAKDASTNKEDAATLIKAGTAFANFANMKPGLENQTFRQTGVPQTTVELFPPVYTTGTVSSFMFSIPTNSKIPEKAMQLLDLMYTDKDIINLFHYGIENKHYMKVSDNIVDFAEGIDSTNSGYNLSQGWMFGNSFLAHVWKGNPEDIWEQTKAFNKSAKKSAAAGFVYNSEMVKTEVAAVQNVVSQFRMGLETGSIDPEKVLPDFIEQMKAAGIDKIVAEKQKQLDAWVAANK